MAVCSKCGSTISNGSSFCGACGSPVSSANTVPPPGSGAAAAGLTSNVAGALSYLLGLVTGIIFLALEPYKRDPFVRFHAFQSILYNVVVIVFWILWSNVVIMGVITLGFLVTIFSLIGSLVYMGFFLYWLFLMYKAYNKETYKIPVLGDWASKQAAKITGD
jgi:uncharacterized membrane protein